MTFNGQTIYDLVGGEDTFKRLVDSFYDRVEKDEELRKIFPEDLEPGKKWQFLFLMQYFGGPQLYAGERGHPRLRMRHMPYTITPDLSNRWVQHMLDAIDEVGIQEPAKSVMRDYFDRGASFMINRFDDES